MKNKQQGFTLIELMIVVLIASILIGIGVPGYRNYVIRASRVDATMALLRIAGSGHRAHPLDTSNEDWFFSIRDFNVFNTVLTEDYDEPVMFDDLIDITDDLTPMLMSSDAGWRLKLEAGPGEKSFTESLTFKGTTLFTTFSPTPASNSCDSANAAGGLNRI